MATDFHMFVIAPLLIILLWKYGPKIVPFAVLIVIAEGIYRCYAQKLFFDEWNANKKVEVPILILYYLRVHRVDSIHDIHFHRTEAFDFLQQLIIPLNCTTSTRFATYIIGILFGYYIDRMEAAKSKLENISTETNVCFWLASILPFLVIIVDIAR